MTKWRLIRELLSLAWKVLIGKLVFCSVYHSVLGVGVELYDAEYYKALSQGKAKDFILPIFPIDKKDKTD